MAFGEERVQENMELAGRMEAMMRQRTPEQATLFLARLIAQLDDSRCRFLHIAFDMAEDLQPGAALMTAAEALREIQEETGEEDEERAPEDPGDTEDDHAQYREEHGYPGYFIL